MKKMICLARMVIQPLTLVVKQHTHTYRDLSKDDWESNQQIIGIFANKKAIHQQQ